MNSSGNLAGVITSLPPKPFGKSVIVSDPALAYPPKDLQSTCILLYY